jgi:hypothetical protein
MSEPTDVSGIAALTILESWLLALNDRKVLTEREILGVLQDAAAAHDNQSSGSESGQLHKAVSALINTIIEGGNSVRRK